ncbi:MAG: DNA-3-methyladenine glycosylase [Acidimicrobiia bacterium]|nr:DNA-3-methyladenine glycosylase [Acidimicrobiia bacterium]
MPNLEGPVEEIAPRLVGATLETRIDGLHTAVVLVEVEAYAESDPASHSFGGMTDRNRSMFGPAGTIYVYRSYGVHWCANLVTGEEGRGEAILLRAGRPVAGVEVMRRRRGRKDHLADGPGKLAQALGLGGEHDGVVLGDLVDLVAADREPQIIATPRIGISKAVDTPWRFVEVQMVG